MMINIKRSDLEIIYDPLIIVLISFIIFVTGILFFDQNNAGTLIGTIIQSLASILAIAVSLTLVAVQLSAQNYSTRILSLFLSRKNQTFWIIVLLYIGTLIYAIILLSIISTNKLNILSIIAVTISILLTSWCILSIPKLYITVLEKLTPENIILELSEKINESSIKFKNNSDKLDGPNPLTPLIDIISSSIQNSDNYAVEMAILEIRKRFVPITNKIITEQIKINPAALMDDILKIRDFIEVIAILNQGEANLGEMTILEIRERFTQITNNIIEDQIEINPSVFIDYILKNVDSMKEIATHLFRHLR